MKKMSLSHTVRCIMLLLIALGLASLAADAPFSWASPLTCPDRQTVPPPTPTPKPAPPAPPALLMALFEMTPTITYAGPGEKVEITVTIHNTTGHAMSNVEALITDVPGLTLEVVQADQGQVVTGSVRWLLGALQPGQVVHLTLRAAMPTNVTPETCFVLVGTLTWSEGGPTQAQASLCAPTSILPKTGE